MTPAQQLLAEIARDQEVALQHAQARVAEMQQEIHTIAGTLREKRSFAFDAGPLERAMRELLRIQTRSVEAVYYADQIRRMGSR